MTRFRTGLEGSRDYTLAGRLSLRPSVEVGLRHDGGDAETGVGMDIGGGLIGADAGSGLAVDVQVRMLVVHQAEGFRERGMAVSLSYNPTPSTPTGFTVKVAPSWGGEARSGAEALWGPGDDGGRGWGTAALRPAIAWMRRAATGCRWAAVFVGTPRFGRRDLGVRQGLPRLGYGLAVLDRESLKLRAGRRRAPP